MHCETWVNTYDHVVLPLCCLWQLVWAHVLCVTPNYLVVWLTLYKTRVKIECNSTSYICHVFMIYPPPSHRLEVFQAMVFFFFLKKNYHKNLSLGLWPLMLNILRQQLICTPITIPNVFSMEISLKV